MPSATTISLADASAVAHVYVPASISASKALYFNNSGASSAGRNDLSITLSRSSRSRASDHVDLKLNFPFEHTVDGVVKVAYTAMFTGKFILPEEMSTVDRDNILAKIGSLIAGATLDHYVKDLEPAY